MAQTGKEAIRVLVVDDDKDMQTTLAAVFEKRGYDVVCAGRATEALELVRKGPFHFAVIDIHLPDMSGTDLLEQIHKINFKINCIMITGDPQKSAAASLQKGASAHLMKPFNLDELVAIFNRKT